MSIFHRIASFLGASRSEAPEPDATTGLPVPAHVAIVMDGNNRWARQRKLPSGSGHRAGVETIRKVLNACKAHGVSTLTLYAFSSENWQRPENEVRELMKLLRSYLSGEVDSLHEKGMRLRFIGRRDRLDADIVSMMESAEQRTAGNSAGTLVLAIDYGGRWDVAEAARQLAARAVAGEISVEGIDEQLLAKSIAMADLPEPDLCIRTGAEHRLSNFLLWQLSYAELYFCDCYWPDFDEREFERALQDYGRRQRRFGLSQEQQSAAGHADVARGGVHGAAGLGRNA